MKNQTQRLIFNMTSTAILSALAIVFMLYVKIPYPGAPWLNIEFSDVVILVSYVSSGFLPALFVTIIKTLVSLLVEPTAGPYVGQLAAIISSLTYLIMLVVCAKCFKLFSKGLGYRIVGYIIILLINAVLMTVLNYWFVTPTYMYGSYTTCFNSEAVKGTTEWLKGFGTNYFEVITVLYLPFNLLKGAIILALYEILFNTLIFTVISKNPKMAMYFKAHRDRVKELKEENENKR